jgi:alpha-galactosidase
MTKAFHINNGGTVWSFDFFDKNKLRLRTVAPAGLRPNSPLPPTVALLELEVALQCTGEDRNAHHGSKFIGSTPGMRLEFVARRDDKVPGGRRIVFEHQDPLLKLHVESVYHFPNGIPAVRRTVKVRNDGNAPVGIEYLASGLMHNFARFGQNPIESKLRLHIPRNTWDAEGQWKTFTPAEAGYALTGMSAITANNVGNWSTSAFLPLGMIENTEAGITWFWQIEHNGSWHWEIGNGWEDLYLYAGGPDEDHHQAWKNLQPGETYETVPVAMGCVKGGFDAATAALTDYRRAACIRPHADNRNCPVIFNDYMNCLFADPTTEKELPLIDAAAAAGCEYYVIDAGWYAERNENWWSTVGLWQPSQTRFAPDGITGLLQLIRKKGMIPGLWLEIESAGVNSPLKDKPDAWFFTRHGRRIVDHGRFQLDFRNPEVRAYADEVIDRVVGEYGAGYIKMDYNVSFQMGTERDADSFGQGLLAHNRAYLAWTRDVLTRYPDLVMENCASGGCRMDYAMLSLLQLQSSSDQTDYRKYPGILVGVLAGVLPEQLAVWAYPKSDGNAREASFNMVNAMLCRIHQSGHLANLPAESLLQVKEGIRIYRNVVRRHIPKSHPFFPLGTPDFTDPDRPVAVGLKNPKAQFLAVWRLAGESTVSLPNPEGVAWKLLYPRDLGIRVRQASGKIQVCFPEKHMGAVLTNL